MGATTNSRRDPNLFPSQFVPPFQGLERVGVCFPGRCPGLICFGPFGAGIGRSPSSPPRATMTRSLGGSHSAPTSSGRAQKAKGRQSGHGGIWPRALTGQRAQDGAEWQPAPSTWWPAQCSKQRRQSGHTLRATDRAPAAARPGPGRDDPPRRQRSATPARVDA
jgi:hypothetical protein